MENKVGRYYRGLYEVASVVNSTIKINEMLQTIVKSVAGALAAKGCSLMLLSPDHRILWHMAAYGLSDQYIHKGPVSVDLSLSEALEGKPVAVNVSTDPRVQYREQAKNEGIAYILGVPVTLMGEVVGVMRVYTSETRHFSQDDVDFVTVVANLGAVALENFRFCEGMRKGPEAAKTDILHWYAVWGASSGLERSPEALIGP